MQSSAAFCLGLKAHIMGYWVSVMTREIAIREMTRLLWLHPSWADQTHNASGAYNGIQGQTAAYSHHRH